MREDEARAGIEYNKVFMTHPGSATIPMNSRICKLCGAISPDWVLHTRFHIENRHFFNGKLVQQMR